MIPVLPARKATRQKFLASAISLTDEERGKPDAGRPEMAGYVSAGLAVYLYSAA